MKPEGIGVRTDEFVHGNAVDRGGTPNPDLLAVHEDAHEQRPSPGLFFPLLAGELLFRLLHWRIYVLFCGRKAPPIAANGYRSVTDGTGGERRQWGIGCGGVKEIFHPLAPPSGVIERLQAGALQGPLDADPWIRTTGFRVCLRIGFGRLDILGRVLNCNFSVLFYRHPRESGDPCLIKDDF